MRTPPWRVTASKYLIDDTFLRLRQDSIELPDGSVIAEYYVRESRGFVMVFAITPEHRVVLVHQYKHGIGRELLELPAGMIDKGEQPLETARRELAEETGYEAESFERVGEFVTDPTNSDTIAHLYIARGALRSREQDLDPAENIDVRLATFNELKTMVRDGSIHSMSHVGAILFVLETLAGGENHGGALGERSS